MNFLTDSLPPSNLVKTESTAKDRKQKGRYNHQSRKAYTNNQNTKSQEEVIRTQAHNWHAVERRSGKDRRAHMENRGRWLESREEKDRRQQAKAIQIKI